MINIICGFCMALADSVPGVSGGTVAFIMGIYEELLESVSVLLDKKKDSRKRALIFILKVLAGWCIGIVMSILFISNMFKNNMYFMSSLFIGLTMASVVYIFGTERRHIQMGLKKLLLTFTGIFIVVIVSYVRKYFVHNGVLNFAQLDFYEGIYLFLVGMIAVSAMVLPGISGSTLLLIFGVYIPLIDALNMFFRMNFTALLGILIFVAGVLFGIFFSVRIIRHLFITKRSSMIYFIIGLTLGSVYAIITGPSTMEIPMSPLSLRTFSFPGFLIGAFLIAALEIYRKRVLKK